MQFYKNKIEHETPLWFSRAQVVEIQNLQELVATPANS